MKYKVSELDGALLDAAVAIVDGHHDSPLWQMGVAVGSIAPYRPSSSWYYGGPIIEREHIDLTTDVGGGWFGWHGEEQVFGPTPLIAAMRTYVASKFGDEVEMP